MTSEVTIRGTRDVTPYDTFKVNFRLILRNHRCENLQTISKGELCPWSCFFKQFIKTL
jgi:hypothetical protein